MRLNNTERLLISLAGVPDGFGQTLYHADSKEFAWPGFFPPKPYTYFRENKDNLLYYGSKEYTCKLKQGLKTADFYDSSDPILKQVLQKFSNIKDLAKLIKTGTLWKNSKALEKQVVEYALSLCDVITMPDSATDEDTDGVEESWIVKNPERNVYITSANFTYSKEASDNPPSLDWKKELTRLRNIGKNNKSSKPINKSNIKSYPAWWMKLDKKEQKFYLKNHPSSKLKITRNV